MNIRKFVYLNWGERYEGMTAHKERYEDMSAQLEQLRIIRPEKKKKKKKSGFTGFKPMTSAIPVQCSTT